MNDDQLHDDLERRSNAVPFHAAELLPGVRGGTSGAPARPARLGGWAPLAGLAAAAVIVIGLVVAWPRSALNLGIAPGTPRSVTVECAGMEESASGISIEDETGLVERCATIPSTGLIGGATNPQGDMTVLDLLLSGSPCDVLAPQTFSNDGNGYYLRTAQPATKCRASLVTEGLRLWLGSPVQASTVSVLTGYAAATSAPADDVACGRAITLHDHSRHVTSCLDAGTVDRHSTAPDVSNPDPSLRTVHVWWGRSQPVSSTAIDVYEISDGAFEISVVDQASPDQPFPDAHAVDITFDIPVPASIVTLRTFNDLTTRPTPSATTVSASGRPFDCGNAVSVIDATDDVESCSATIGSPVPAQDYFIASPTSITAFWTGATCQPIVDSVFSRTSTGADLAITAHNPPDLGPGPSCAGGPIFMTLTVTLRSPLSLPSAVTVEFGDQALSNLTDSPPRSSQTLPPVPPPTQSPLTDHFNCSDTTATTAVRLIDHTGLVTECAAALQNESRTPAPILGTPSSNTYTASFWIPCDGDLKTTNLELWARRSVNGTQRPYVLTADRRDASGGCLIGSGERVVAIALSEPLSSSDVQLVDVEDGAAQSYVSDDQSGLGFNLSLETATSTYATDLAISATAKLTVVNEASDTPVDATLGGSGQGLIAFGVEQLDGPLAMTPVWTADLRPYTIKAYEPYIQSFAKSGGFSNDDPNANFWRDYFADPQLHLPPGNWLLSADAIFNDVPEGGGQITLSTAVVVTVTSQ
jgi:hypothetical protein